MTTQKLVKSEYLEMFARDLTLKLEEGWRIVPGTICGCTRHHGETAWVAVVEKDEGSKEKEG